MNRLACFAALMLLSAPAYARDSFFFHFRGHDIHVEAARHCRSLSCFSVSVDNGRYRSDRDDDDDYSTSRDVAPSPSPSPLPNRVQSVPAPVQSAAPVMRAQTYQTAPVAQLPVQAPMSVQVPPVQPPPVQMQPPPPPPPPPPPVQVQPSPLPAPALASVPSPQLAPPPPAQPEYQPEQPARIEPLPNLHPRPTVVEVQAPVAQAMQRTESEDTDSPLGEWQTEGKNNLVRIEACGDALCGYAYDPVTRTTGETVLVNMKSKDDDKWTGTIYSRSSGNSYYSKMTLKAPNTLRVEACAIGSFWCSGNTWTRVSSPAGHEVMSVHPALPAHS